MYSGIGSFDAKPKQFAKFRVCQNATFTTSESKFGKFRFGLANRFESIRLSNRIESNRIANRPPLLTNDKLLVVCGNRLDIYGLDAVFQSSITLPEGGVVLWRHCY